MKYLSTYIFILLLVTVSCSVNDSNNNKEEELAILNQQKAAIEEIASSSTCTESSTCKYIAFGSKPCGGPKTFLAYNSTIDETLLVTEVAIYNENEDAFNLKWGIVSDCAVVMPPTSVECVDGKCTAIYN